MSLASRLLLEPRCLAVRRAIEARSLRLLRPVESQRATLRLVRSNSGSLAVTKDFCHTPPTWRMTVGRYLIAREAAAYRRLEGVPGIPRLLAHPSPDVLAIEYIPGVEVGQLPPGGLPKEALSQLRETLEGMHRAGVLHLDLGHDSNGDFGRETNMIWSDQGRLHVIDLAGALLAPVPRPVFQALARHDLLAVTKLKRRFFGAPGPGPDELLPRWVLALFRMLKKL